MATCHYNSSFTLTKVVRAGAHRVRANYTGPGTQRRDRSLALPGSRMSSGLGLGFSNVKTTSIVKGSATDSSPAAFTKRAVTFSNPAEVEYRVRVDMYWYDCHGKQIGRATHAPDWYGWVATSHGSGIEESDVCGPAA